MTIGWKFHALNQNLASRRDISPAAKIVWAVIVNCMGENGVCWPGVRTIGKKAGVTKDTADKATKELEKAGWLKVERRSRGQSNLYRLPSESVLDSMTLEESECHKAYDGGVIKPRTQVSQSLGHNKKEYKKTHKRARKKAEAHGFAQFWQVFPRKVAKQAAERAWEKLAPDGDTRAQIMASIEQQKDSDQWTRDNGRFIPHPATWLRGERWMDEMSISANGEGQVARTTGDELVSLQLRRTAERKR